ncbi:MAG: 3-phosphoserine/phosphohydroxythreonine transaminase [Planctomycetaceae bacterium]|jgi:phosphoserine aminotransferase|nr:3-phosphoserine/phosphohydroxythreonine transaminase [Planctomycetaceae bacterium]
MSVSDRVYNFSAGPAVLPFPVLKKAQEELLCLPGVGASVMEISHRSKAFEPIIEGAETNIRTLLNIPNNYRVLFLQGGALLQFAMIPVNLLNGRSANYVISGSWSKKASSEANLLGNTKTVWDGKNLLYKRKPAAHELLFEPDAAYVYICSNETIEGIQYQEYPNTGEIPLICDSSSDFFCKPVDISRFGLLYACAQKNAGPAGVTVVIIRDDLLEYSGDRIPSLLSYKKIAEAKSMLNTPPCFAIYIVKLVTEWLLHDIGGLDKMYAINKEKAALLYEVIDHSNGFYQGHADKACRSIMNVPFRLPSEELDKKFQEEAKKVGLTTLGGHRSVGGLRASIYNAMPREGVVTLCNFMDDFAQKNKGNLSVK